MSAAIQGLLASLRRVLHVAFAVPESAPVPLPVVLCKCTEGGAYLLVHMNVAAGVCSQERLSLGTRQPGNRDWPRAIHALIRIEVAEGDQLLIRLRLPQLRLERRHQHCTAHDRKHRKVRGVSGTTHCVVICHQKAVHSLVCSAAALREGWAGMHVGTQAHHPQSTGLSTGPRCPALQCAHGRWAQSLRPWGRPQS